MEKSEVEDCGQCSDWVGGEHGEGLPVLKVTVAMTAQRRVPRPRAEWSLRYKGTPGDTPGEPSEGAFWTVIKTKNA